MKVLLKGITFNIYFIRTSVVQCKWIVGIGVIWHPTLSAWKI